METIFALASGRGRGAVAVLRLSGPGCDNALNCLTGLGLGVDRKAEVRELRDPASGLVLDQALVLSFRGPKSFTGEDVVELHLHGGLAVVDSVLLGLGKIAGLRPAVAGEFSRRAVENGKFDLSVAEGIADLIEAESEAQKRQALRQMSGAFGKLCESWRTKIIKALAYVEAEIDFSDEEIPDDLSGSILPLVDELIGELTNLLQDRRGEQTRDGILVAIVGPPNAGKSSLVNYLAGRDAVIVSPEAGTTRDLVEVRLSMAGQAVTVCDTAGLREAVNEVEREGVRRAHKAAGDADLRIWMRAVGDDLANAEEGIGTDDLILVNKIDLDPLCQMGERELGISLVSGFGLETMADRLETLVENLFGGVENAILTRARHRQEVSLCRDSLVRAAALARVGGEIALVGEELRQASHFIGRVTGRVDVEDLLDVVFRDFCIGK